LLGALLALTLVACEAAGAAKEQRPPPPRFALPYALVYGPDGALYIGEGGAGRILRYDFGTKRLTVFARGFRTPAHVIRSGAFLIASDLENHRVVRVDRRGRVTKLVGVRAPVGLAQHGNRLFVSSLESFIVEVDLATREVRQIAGDGTPESTGDGGPASAARVETPHGIATDAQGNLYLDGGGTIRRIDAATGTISTVSREEAFSFEIGPDGTIWFVEGRPSGGSVRRLEADGSATVLAGNGTLRPGADGPGPTRGLLPADVLLTQNGRALLVSQTRPFPAVRRLDLRTGRLTTILRSR
jgi:hypothetical protein